jgi:hypothetical protein
MKVLFYILILWFPISLVAQTEAQKILQGNVSYISAQNIYTKFENTEGIDIGDTLFIQDNAEMIPAIIVEHKSSTSCAGVSITNNQLNAGTVLSAYVKIPTQYEDSLKTDEIVPVEAAIIPVVVQNEIDTPPLPIESLYKLAGKISVQSYSNFTNQKSSYDYQRWRYTFRLNANHIGNSGFTYSHYLSFAYRASDWNRISSNLSEAIRVYDLAMKYNFTDDSFIWFGRHLNNKISNISSIDGLQFETAIDEWSFGAAVGSRPDFNNMGLNLKLFEYGIYVNRADILANGNNQNTIGFFEQTNDFRTDRRFLYYQHSNSAIENTRIFLSTEVDLFKKEMGENKTDLSLTSLYTSVNIRPSDLFSIFFSYDARKNVIYYETFKTLVDSIIENETRQGFRTRLILKPIRNLFVGANYGYRFRKGDLKPSNNYGGYVTYSQIPGIESSATLSFNKLSSYVEGNLWSASLSRPIVYGFDMLLGYRFTNYKFRSGIEDLKQHSASINLNTYLLKPVLLNLTYEGIFEKVRSSGRLLINLTYRF